jgi:hypothetical protein
MSQRSLTVRPLISLRSGSIPPDLTRLGTSLNGALPMIVHPSGRDARQPGGIDGMEKPVEILAGWEYSYIAMSMTVRNDIRREVLRYLRGCTTPVRMSYLASELRARPKLKALRDSDFRAIVQPMIATGKLSYASGLKIKIGSSSD